MGLKIELNCQIHHMQVIPTPISGCICMTDKRSCTFSAKEVDTENLILT